MGQESPNAGRPGTTDGTGALLASFDTPVEKTADGRPVIPLSDALSERTPDELPDTIRVAVYKTSDTAADPPRPSETTPPAEREPPASDPPVASGDYIDVEIQTLGEEGDGLAWHDGFVIIVPGTTPGDEVVVEIERVQDTFAIGNARA